MFLLFCFTLIIQCHTIIYLIWSHFFLSFVYLLETIFHLFALNKIKNANLNPFFPIWLLLCEGKCLSMLKFKLKFAYVHTFIYACVHVCKCICLCVRVNVHYLYVFMFLYIYIVCNWDSITMAQTHCMLCL